MAKLDIHDYEKGYLSASEGISKSTIYGRNKEIISSFSDDCLSEGLGKPRIIKYLHTLKTLARMFEKNFDDATSLNIVIPKYLTKDLRNVRILFP